MKDTLRPGSTAVVIGMGGQFAVELLRALTGVRIIALDVKEAALAAVRHKVDYTFVSGSSDVAEQVMEAAGDYGADFVLDLVGSSATLQLAGAVVAPYGAIRVPGLTESSSSKPPSYLPRCRGERRSLAHMAGHTRTCMTSSR
ncbi:zinc-binding dehydrogenase [Rhodococcus jostii]|uniref:Zinc-binding dehydrogenase n=1 Tax=Rhodococcus jostii TaxID=132919 RepID=A0ABU4CG08_RHOJO|nr:zinc-binding dehydrogenase [Rhodococcus jostii]MDV6282477.1 zinc-binding dehydrogenase [Rhodococcus jostii]